MLRVFLTGLATLALAAPTVAPAYGYEDSYEADTYDETYDSYNTHDDYTPSYGYNDEYQAPYYSDDGNYGHDGKTSKGHAVTKVTKGYGTYENDYNSYEADYSSSYGYKDESYDKHCYEENCYDKDSYGKDSYDATYKDDSYEADYHGKDSYGKDSYGKNSYGKAKSYVPKYSHKNGGKYGSKHDGYEESYYGHESKDYYSRK
jgi:hypothetical protein